MDFQERIARAKEAARLASIAAMSRGAAPSTQPSPAAPSTSASPPSSSHAGHTQRSQQPPPPPPTPPADVLHRIDRLVEFIGRNGPAFEALTCERERDNPSFAFLRAGAPYHDYFVWKKQQQLTPSAASSTETAPPTSSPPNWDLGLLTEPDPMLRLSVGAMANVCRLAKARGVSPYGVIPSAILNEAPSAPTVEPGRLEVRLDEYYRGTL
ncbi:hypothetical protein PINS_up004816 [Pythium insidiosum]|nr:hypothetical protein PINS_up004816 [Pythium insidiosum]